MAKFGIVHQGVRLEAPEGQFLVGRSPECNLVIDDPSVSRVHGAIIHEGGRLFAEDRGSRNGIKVNDKPIQGRAELFDGDRLAFGRQEIRIVASDSFDEGRSTVEFRSHPGKIQELRETAERTVPAPKKSRGRFDTISEHQPIPIRAGLAVKAARVGKLEEAERLVKNSLEHAFKKIDSGKALADNEYAAVTEALVVLAELSGSSEFVSLLFAFHHADGRLMSQDLVEKLYELVRVAAYRKCGEMSAYLELLESKSGAFTPPERFVQKRLEGLVKLCS